MFFRRQERTLIGDGFSRGFSPLLETQRQFASAVALHRWYFTPWAHNAFLRPISSTGKAQ